ncbi:MAG: hypothetical protein JNG89_16755 [Planctomycetaceae bacterium]|nr:hypothetical protein [Planctomycetaceae bacterium]
MYGEQRASRASGKLRAGQVPFRFDRLAVRTLLSAFAVCLGLAGCGGELDTVSVDGTVTYDGKPLEMGIVRFVPVDPEGMLATGPLKAGGEFTLSTRGSDGVLEGDYTVTVESFLIDDTVPEKDRELGIGGKKSAIPQKYSDPETSGLKETIDGSRSISIELQKE